MPSPLRNFTYQSPPDSGSNDGALPKAYDPSWQKWINLTPQQIAAFQAFPEDLMAYIAQSRWQWEVRGRNTPGPPTTHITLPADANHPAIAGIQLYTDDRSQAKIGQLKQAIDSGLITFPFPFLAVNGVFMLEPADCVALYGYVVRYVQATYAVAADLLGKVQAKQVTTRAAIDAAFATIAVA